MQHPMTTTSATVGFPNGRAIPIGWHMLLDHHVVNLLDLYTQITGQFNIGILTTAATAIAMAKLVYKFF